MAKKSKIIHNSKVNSLVKSLKQKRANLLNVLHSNESSLSDKLSILKFFTKKRSSSITRYKNRCNITGYSRSYLRNFGLSKKVFYDYASLGVISGIKKSN